MTPVRSATRTDAAWCAAVFIGALVVSIVLTWPLVLTPGRVVLPDVGDPLLNTWLLWWNSWHVPLTEAWWNASMFFPATGAMAFSEHLLGLSVFVSPMIWLTGNPLLAYNAMLLLTFAFSAVAAFLLMRALGTRRDAAILAAALFAFAPYRLGQLTHLQVLAAYWMPIGLLGLHKFLDDGRARWLITFAIAWLLQALSNGYFAVFYSVLIACWMLWHARAANWRRIAAMAGAGIAAAACLLPIIWKYVAVHDAYGFVRRAREVEEYSADLASILQPPRLSAVWDWLNVYARGEADLFPGITAPAIILICGASVLIAHRGARPLAAAIRSRSAALFYPIAAAVMFFFALGPVPTYFGTPVLSTAPYAWLSWLPGTSALRVPSRFGMLMALCLAIGAALVFARATARWPRRRQIAAASFVVTLAVAESWTNPMPLWDPPRAFDLRADDIDNALLVLPMLNAYNEMGYLYRASAHGRPLVNGYSGHFPPWYRQLKDGLNSLDPAVLDALARAGVTQVAVVRRHDSDGTWQRFVQTRADKVSDSVDGLFTLFDVRPVAPATLVSRRRVPIARAIASVNPARAGVMIDADEQTAWSTLDPQNGDEVVTLELEHADQIDAIELVLGQRRGSDYPRQLVIEVSPDGQTWREVWRGAGVGAALAGAMHEPRRNPMHIEFERSAVRAVRLRQVSRTPEVYWSIAEIAVLSR